MNDYQSVRVPVELSDGAVTTTTTGALNCELHALHNNKGGDPRKPHMVLIHGADRRTQKIAHWTPHLPFLAKHCQVYAVDMLGHGASRPSESDILPNGVVRIDIADQVKALTKLIELDVQQQQQQQHCHSTTDCINQQFILVGRSYGGNVSARLAQVLSSGRVKGANLAGLVLIAPATEQAVIESLPKSLPVLAFWSQEDQIIPPSKGLHLLQSHFNNVQVKLFEKGEILSDTVIKRGETWRAHTPENEKVAEFQAEMETFLSKIQH